MADNSFLVGAGSGIIGIMVGFLLSGAGDDRVVNRLEKRINSGTERAVSAGAEQVDALNERIAGLEAALAEAGEAQAGSVAGLKEQLAGLDSRIGAMDGKIGDAVASLSGRIDAVTASVGDAVAEAGSNQTARIEAALSEGLGKVAALAPAAAAGGAAAAASDGESAVAAPAETEAVVEEAKGLGIGQTEYLMDGKVRVFVSSVNRDAGTARVAVNGQHMVMIGDWHDGDFMIGEVPCNVILDSMVDGLIQVSAACEEELPQ